MNLPEIDTVFFIRLNANMNNLYFYRFAILASRISDIRLFPKEITGNGDRTKWNLHGCSRFDAAFIVEESPT
jgi:hypothetical protein